ncbi:hypothetical protein LTS15_007087 [Exophiala xenobiotica]|nr:hypothetical protein LTS15_007087 [Exophiala xenobiotica]
MEASNVQKVLGRCQDGPSWKPSILDGPDDEADPAGYTKLLSNLDARSAFVVELSIPKNHPQRAEFENGDIEMTRSQKGWPIYHPQSSAFEEFRDGIRRQFELHSKGLNLTKITLHTTSDIRQSFPTVFYPSSSGRPSWDAIKNQFEDNASQSKFAFEVDIIDKEDRGTKLVYESTLAESVLGKVADDLLTAGLAEAAAEEDLLQMD